MAESHSSLRRLIRGGSLAPYDKITLLPAVDRLLSAACFAAEFIITCRRKPG